MVGKAAGMVAVAILVTVASITPGGAITLETIQGHVRDPLGRPLPTVAVTDRTNVAYTDRAGSYKLNESLPENYQVTAGRSGINGGTRTVSPIDALNPVDFTLTYVITGALARSTLSTATAAATTTLTITSFAPAAGACVTVTDTRTNSTNSAAFIRTSGDGSSTYTYTLTVPRGTPERSYAVRFSASTCGPPKTLLSNVQSVSYLVDNTGPA